MKLTNLFGIAAAITILSLPYTSCDSGPDSDVFATPQSALKSITISASLDSSSGSRSVVNPQDNILPAYSTNYNSLGQIFADIVKCNISTYSKLEYGKNVDLDDFKINPAQYSDGLKAFIQSMDGRDVIALSKWQHIRMDKNAAGDQVIVKIAAGIQPNGNGPLSPAVLLIKLTKNKDNLVDTEAWLYYTMASSSLFEEVDGELKFSPTQIDWNNAEVSTNGITVKVIEQMQGSKQYMCTENNTVYGIMNQGGTPYYTVISKDLIWSGGNFYNLESFLNGDISTKTDYIIKPGMEINVMLNHVDLKGELSYDESDFTMDLNGESVNCNNYFGINGSSETGTYICANLTDGYEDFFTIKEDSMNKINTLYEAIHESPTWDKVNSELEAITEIPSAAKYEEELINWLEVIGLKVAPTPPNVD